MRFKWDLRETPALAWQEAPVPHGLHLLQRVHKGFLRKGHGTSGDPTTGCPAGLAWRGSLFLPMTVRCFLALNPKES